MTYGIIYCIIMYVIAFFYIRFDYSRYVTTHPAEHGAIFIFAPIIMPFLLLALIGQYGFVWIGELIRGKHEDG